MRQVYQHTSAQPFANQARNKTSSSPQPSRTVGRTNQAAHARAFLWDTNAEQNPDRTSWLCRQEFCHDRNHGKRCFSFFGAYSHCQRSEESLNLKSLVIFEVDFGQRFRIFNTRGGAAW